MDARVRDRDRIPVGFSLGSLQAEFDDLLGEAYFDSGDYHAMSSMEDRRCFIVGRTGTGKSAAFSHLREFSPATVIELGPVDELFQHLMNLDVLNRLNHIGVDSQPFLKYLWKHCLVLELLRNKMSEDSEESRLFRIMKLKIGRKERNADAVEYIEKYENSFWNSFDERVREIADNWQTEFKKEFGLEGGVANSVGNIGVSSSDSDASSVAHSETMELTQRYQRWVNEVQLSKLNSLVRALDEEIVSEPVFVVIDRLDEILVDGVPLANILRGLVSCVFDLNRDVGNLKILVALRTNIFNQIRMGSSDLGQREKFKDLVLTMEWTKDKLKEMLDMRALAASRKIGLIPPFQIPASLPDRAFRKGGVSSGRAIDYLLDRTLLRPRDAISFVNTALASAAGTDRITWNDIFEGEIEHSSGRFDALVDEWKSPYNGLERVLTCFKGCGSVIDRVELANLLMEVAYLLPDGTFEGGSWLTRIAMPIWETPRSEENWWDAYGLAVEFLFAISFLGVSKSEDGQMHYSSGSSAQERRMAERGPDDDVNYFRVHPAFARYLEIGAAMR